MERATSSSDEDWRQQFPCGGELHERDRAMHTREQLVAAEAERGGLRTERRLAVLLVALLAQIVRRLERRVVGDESSFDGLDRVELFHHFHQMIAIVVR